MLPNLVVYGFMFGSSLRFTCSRVRPLYLADYWLIPEKASLVPILVLVPNGLLCVYRASFGVGRYNERLSCLGAHMVR